MGKYILFNPIDFPNKGPQVFSTAARHDTGDVVIVTQATFSVWGGGVNIGHRQVI